MGYIFIAPDIKMIHFITIFVFSFLIGVHVADQDEIAERERSSASSRNTSLAGSLVKRKRNLKSFYKVSFTPRVVRLSNLIFISILFL